MRDRHWSKINLFEDDTYIDEDEITRDFTDDSPTDIAPSVIEIWADLPGTIVGPAPSPRY